MNENYDYLIQRAAHACANHDHDTVVELATRAISLDPAKTDAYYWRGLAIQHLRPIARTHGQPQRRATGL